MKSIQSLLFVVIFLLPSLVFSMDYDERKAFVASLIKGQEFTNDKKEYALVPGLKAINTYEEGSSQEKAFKTLKADHGLAVQQVVETKGSFTIYQPLNPSRSKTLMLQKLSDSSANGSLYPVVINLRSQTLGIFTGDIWVKLKTVEDATYLVRAYPLVLDYANASMKTAFYKILPGEDLLALRTKLKKDPRVISVTFDIFERQKIWR